MIKTTAPIIPTPFPIPLAVVIISGITSLFFIWKSQKALPNKTYEKV